MFVLKAMVITFTKVMFLGFHAIYVPEFEIIEAVLRSDFYHLLARLVVFSTGGVAG